QSTSSQFKKQSLTPVKEMLTKASKQELSRLKHVWGEVMGSIRREKVSAHAWLKDSEPVACSDDSFLLSFPYEMHSQMASTDQIRVPVEQVVTKVVKKPMIMLTIVDTDWEQVKQSFIRNQQEDPKDESS